jgi:TolB-like protein
MLPFRSNSSLADQSEELLEELLMAFGERGGAELGASTTAMAYRGRSGDVRQFAAECNADFVVEGSLRRRNDMIEAMVWLIDGHSGHAIRSKRITGSSPVDLSLSTTAWLLEADRKRPV